MRILEKLPLVKGATTDLSKQQVLQKRLLTEDQF